MAGKRPNWDRIKAEYLKGGIGYRPLAAKHGVSESTLTKRAIRESWDSERQRIGSEFAAELPRRVLESKVMDAQEALERMSNFARGGMGRVATWGAGGVVLRESDELSPDDLSLVVEVSETRRPDGSGSIKIKLADPQSAVRDMLKHHGLLDGGAESEQSDSAGVTIVPADSPDWAKHCEGRVDGG